MLKVQWNALRVGDHVDAHDPDEAALRLVAGVVTMVQSRVGANDVGVMLGATPALAHA